MCAKFAMPAMALLDTDGVYGAPRFHLAAKKLKIKAHIGAEATTFSPRSHGVTEKNNQKSIIKKQLNSSVSPCLRGEFRLPLLVSSRAGYQNLCRLITKMKLRGKKGEGAVHPEELEEHAQGLICLTGGADGPLAAALRHGGIEEAREQVEQLIGLFGHGNVYVELQRHFHREEEARNRAVIAIAQSLNLPLLATNGVCYATAKDRELCDAFTALRHHRTLSTAGRLLARNSERHLKSPQEMRQLFADLPQALANTLELSSRLEFTLNDLGYEFPRYPVPEGETMNSFLRDRSWEGFRERYGKKSQDMQARARRQIERELSLIEKLKLAGYFLIVWDLIRFCREQNILVQGRGSAANSAVCYSLGITAVDPISMELLFERFLSEERGEWPDIDLDLPSGDEREKVIQYVYRRYGERGAAMTANVITYRNKMAAREMGKVLGFDEETLAKISAAVATWEFRDENDALDRRFRDAGLDLKHPRLRKYYELCLAVQDMPRHLGQHSGGMVICQGQLDSVVPLEPASMPGRVVVQWDKEDCADMGIIKVDLLGLGMMAVLKDSIELIQTHYREEVDLAQLPQDDPAVYSALQEADTIGLFQVESRAQMACLPRLRPKRFYDIVVQVAIIRPGPIVGQMVNPFLQRRQGREDVTYPHPSLEPVLKRTLGVPLFQEQLLRIAMIAANFSGGEAEDLRRAMGFKRSEARMKEIEAKLRAGMTRKWNRAQSSGRNYSFHYFFRALRISRIARRQLCAHRLRQRFFEMPLPGCVHRRIAQQSADGFLFSRNHHERRAASRIENTASGCDEVGLDVRTGNMGRFTTEARRHGEKERTWPRSFNEFNQQSTINDFVCLGRSDGKSYWIVIPRIVRGTRGGWNLCKPASLKPAFAYPALLLSQMTEIAWLVTGIRNGSGCVFSGSSGSWNVLTTPEPISAANASGTLRTGSTRCLTRMII